MSAARHTALPIAFAAALLFASGHGHAVTITVSSGDDSTSHTPCTLRNAITSINYGNAVLYAGCRSASVGLFGNNDTVVFAANLAGSTITLSQGAIANYAPLTIAGSGQTIDAANASGVLSTIAFFSLSNVTLANGNSTARGGALYASQAFVSLNNVRVTSSHATSGGGIAIENGSAAFTNTVVVGNSGGNGAGLFVSAASVTLTNSTVADNTSTCANACGGGVAVVSGSELTITASTLARNTAISTAAGAAGALYANDSKVTLVNSTMADNSATGPDAVAGAVLENQSTASTTRGAFLTNATLASNTATSAGPNVTGGVLIGSAGTGFLAMANTILAGNSAFVGGVAAPAPDLLANGTTSADHSLLGNALFAGYSGDGNLFSDTPGLAPLGDYGGPTATMALLGASPGIDAGSNAAALNAASQPLTADQRGHIRTVDGIVDIGAYEFPGDEIFGDHFGS